MNNLCHTAAARVKVMLKHLIVKLDSHSNTIRPVEQDNNLQ